MAAACLTVQISVKTLKVRPGPADTCQVLVLLTLLTAGYFAAVIRVRRAGKLRRAAQPEPVELPEEDRPPETAVGWPPLGAAFSTYVDDGFAALDAYLSEGFAA